MDIELSSLSVLFKLTLSNRDVMPRNVFFYSNKITESWDLTERNPIVFLLNSRDAIMAGTEPQPLLSESIKKHAST